MHKLLRGIILLGVLWLVLGGMALAQGNIQVVDTKADISFAQSIVFKATLISSQNLTPQNVTLYYKVNDGPLNRRPVADFAPGTRVQLSAEEKMQPGQIPPFANITYQWRVEIPGQPAQDTPPQTVPYTDNRFQWQNLANKGVTVYWYNQDKAYGQHVLDTSNQAIARLSTSFGVSTDKPIKVVVYQSKVEMQQALSSRGQTYDQLITTLGVVVSEDTLLLLGQQSDPDATTNHELTHVIVGIVTKNPYNEIPSWLNEGLAMYNEGPIPAGNKGALDEGIRSNTLMTIRTMTSQPGRPDQVNLFYGQARSIVDFMLQKYGKEKMAQVLNVFKEGSTTDGALQKVYGFNMDGLDQQWRASVGAQPLPQSQPAAAATPPAAVPTRPAVQAVQPTQPAPANPPAQVQPAATAAPAVEQRPQTQVNPQVNQPLGGGQLLPILIVLVCCGAAFLLIAGIAVVIYALRQRPATPPPSQ
ncbi:MAG: hypothetical protein EXR62_08465 [Chloroflexi bacterium]|nr:hypothetical protein [Chloroflexota bacterium]